MREGRFRFVCVGNTWPEVMLPGFACNWTVYLFSGCAHAQVFPHAIALDGSFYVASVTPVVHYTMGGVAIDDSARALVR